jgi:hypothetical protein
MNRQIFQRSNLTVELEIAIFPEGKDGTNESSKRFILHPLKQIKARSLRVAVVVFFVIIVIFFAVAFVFLFVFFLVGLLSKEDIGRPIRRV